tara:strand:- start:34469 stop:37477 length:3009 start_codon:yes stop_codon:yes gene_type:complete
VADDQLDTAKELRKVYSDIADLLNQQLTLQMSIKGVAEQSWDKMFKSSGEMQDNWKKAFEQMNQQSSKSLGSMSRDFDSYGSRVSGTFNMQRGLFAGSKADITSLTTLLTDLGGLAEIIGGDTYDQMRQMREEFGGSVFEIAKIQDGYKATGKLLDTAIKDNNRLAMLGTKVSLEAAKTIGNNVDGIDASIHSVFGSYDNYMNRINQLLRDNTLLAQRMSENSKAFDRDTMSRMRYLQEALGWSNQEVAALLNRQMSMTGEVNTKLLEKAAIYSKVMQKTTGQNFRIIGDNFVNLSKHVSKFGSLTEQQVAVVSTQLAQLNIDFQSFDGFIGGFRGFNSAAQKVGRLTAAFGVNLNAYELMQKAWDDPVGALKDVVQGLQDAGWTAERLQRSPAHLSLLVKDINLTDEQILNAMRARTTSTAELQKILDETDKKMKKPGSKAELMGAFAQDVNLARVNLENLDDVIATRVLKTLNQDIQGGVSNAIEQMHKLGDESAKLGGKLAKQGLADLAKLFEAIVTMDPNKVGRAASHFKNFGAGVSEAVESVSKGEFAKAFEGFADAIKETDIGRNFVESISIALKDSKSIDGMATSLGDIFKKAGVKAGVVKNSPGPRLAHQWGAEYMKALASEIGDPKHVPAMENALVAAFTVDRAKVAGEMGKAVVEASVQSVEALSETVKGVIGKDTRTSLGIFLQATTAISDLFKAQTSLVKEVKGYKDLQGEISDIISNRNVKIDSNRKQWKKIEEIIKDSKGHVDVMVTAATTLAGLVKQLKELPALVATEQEKLRDYFESISTSFKDVTKMFKEFRPAIENVEWEKFSELAGHIETLTTSTSQLQVAIDKNWAERTKAIEKMGKLMSPDQLGMLADAKMMLEAVNNLKIGTKELASAASANMDSRIDAIRSINDALSGDNAGLLAQAIAKSPELKKQLEQGSDTAKGFDTLVEKLDRLSKAIESMSDEGKYEFSISLEGEPLGVWLSDEFKHPSTNKVIKMVRSDKIRR